MCSHAMGLETLSTSGAERLSSCVIAGIKFVGGAAHTMQRSAVVDLVEIAHEHDLYVCESGLLEHAASRVSLSDWKLSL